MTQNNETRPDMQAVQCNARDRVYNKNGIASGKNVCASTTCDTCGRLSCNLRGSEGIIVCHNYISPDILRRTVMHTPVNEARIRGCR